MKFIIQASKLLDNENENTDSKHLYNYSMIFRTFDNGNIDNWTEKIGIFGKSFRDLGIAIDSASKSTIDNVSNFNSNIDFWENLRNNLFSKKEDIQSLMVELPEIIDSSKATQYLNAIKAIESGTLGNIDTFQKWYDTLDDSKQWIAEYAQSTQGQIRSTESVIAANKAARQSAINYNNSLKSMTLGAKAAAIGMKALAIAGNIIVFAAISKSIQLAIGAIDDYIHRVDNAKEALNSSQEVFNSTISEIESLTSELNKCKEQIDEINTLDGAQVARDGELEKLQMQSKELENQLALKKEQARLEAIELADNASNAYNTTVHSQYEESKSGFGFISGFGVNVSPDKEFNLAIERYQNYANKKAVVDKQIEDKTQELANAQSKGIDTTSLYRDIEQLQKTSNSYQHTMDNASHRANEMAEIITKVESSYKRLDNSGQKLTEQQKNELLSVEALNQVYISFLDNLNKTSEVDITPPDTSSNSSTFPLFNLADEDTAKAIDNYQKQFTTLSSAIEKVKENKLTGSDLLDLQQEFPALIGTTDDLNVALNKLVDETLTHVISYLKTAGASDDLIETFKQIAKEARSLSNVSILSYSDAIAELNKYTDAFKVMDKAYEHFIDKDSEITFDDLASISEKFKDVSGIESYVKAIQDAKGNTEATQKAFNDLTSAYIEHAGILNQVNQENASLIQSYLHEQGITNAEILVQDALAYSLEKVAAEKYYNEQASAALEGATLNEVNRILDEADAAGIASSVIAQLALDKISVNDAQIDTASDIDQIINLANAAGSSALALSALANAKAVLGTDIGNPNSDKYDPQRVRTAMDTIDKLEAGTFDYGFQLDPDKFKSATYGGGTKTNKSGGSKDKSSKENSDIDWIDRRISLIKKKNSELESTLSDTYTAYTGLTKEEINRVNELFASNLSPASSEIDELIKLANKAGMSIGELQKAVQTGSGLESRQSILGELIANDKIIISEYQNSVDQYKQSYEELVAKVPEYRDKIENGGVNIELLSGDAKTQIQNAIDAFDKLNNAESNVDDATRELKNHNKEYYKNISDSIESSNSKLVDSNNLIEKQIDLLSTSGHTVSSSMYESLIKNTEGQIRNAQKLLANKRVEMNELIGSGVSKDSEEYSNLRSEISDAEGSIIDLEKAQEEYNRKLLEIPVDNLDKIIGMYNDITEAMENWRDEYEASGKKVDADYFQSLIHNGVETIDQLKEQANLIDDIMDEYDVGSEPWLDMYDRLKSCNSEMSSMVQNLNEWNEELLSMPLNSINEFSDSLNKVLTGLNSQKGEYDTVISAVTGAIKAQIDALNDEKKAFEDSINSEKDALQKKLDLLEKQNEKLKLQRNLEHALYNLQVANTQKTEQVKLLPEHTVMYGRFKYAC